ncbi:acyloxyacyl hydrolase [Candidatus Nitrospira bockiana]
MVSIASLAIHESHAEDVRLISVSARVGFSGQTFLGKEQKHNFQLYDLAALFDLPWGWPLGETGWALKTRLITSGGALVGAGDTGFVATVVPALALTAWNGALSFDVGGGGAVFTRQKFGDQDFGGPFQFVATAGIALNPSAHAHLGLRLQHFSDAALYKGGLGVDLYLVEIGYRF